MTAEPAHQYDVFIVGGGPVGASLALALEGRGFAVGLAEARDIAGHADSPPQPGYDDKALALSHATVQALRGLSLWPALAGEATPILSVHVSQRGRLGRARLTAEEAGEDALGHVVPAPALGAALNARLLKGEDTVIHAPASLAALDPGAQAVELTLKTPEGSRNVRARLVVGADGVGSVVRNTLAMPAREDDYRQLALAANVTPGEQHEGRAFERFTGQGPLALLPMSGRRMGLVWAAPDASVRELMGLSDDAFLARLQEAFGMRLGRFQRVGRRKSYPLAGVRATALSARRTVLVGNAAQTLHPVAAQGFNLGVRDVVALAETLVEARERGEDPGGDAVIARYLDWRRADRERTAGFTHALVRLFDSDLPLLAHARGLGLMALDLVLPLKRAFARRAMGLSGRVPRLARGAPLE